MAKAWSELRSEIRYQLKDSGSTPKWADGELLVYVNYALRDYSRYFPVEGAADVALSTDGSATINSDWTILAVEYPDNSFLDELVVKPGTKLWSSTTGYYMLEGKMWVVHSDDPSTVRVHYTTVRDTVSADSDTVNVPAEDEELIALYVLAKCTERVGEQSANLDRWREGRRDDNPLVVMQNHYYIRYIEGIGSRMAGRQIAVKWNRRRSGTFRSRRYW